MDMTQIEYYLKTAESHARNLEFSLQQLRKLLNQQNADAEHCVQSEHQGQDTTKKKTILNNALPAWEPERFAGVYETWVQVYAQTVKGRAGFPLSRIVLALPLISADALPIQALELRMHLSVN